MKKSTILLTILAAVAFAAAAEAQDLYTNNRAPLVHKPYMELPLGAVKADGWLKDQLDIMAAGMTGHLDRLVPKIFGERNGWLGGDGDKWERGPYWIDGLVPLAYILDDDALKAKAQPWIEWALASQQEDGFFGPSEDLPNVDGLQRDRTHDWWPRMVVLKFLKQYYDATGDARVPEFMTKYFRYQLEHLPVTPLGNWSFWAAERGADNLYIVYWLYNITGDEFLLDLGNIIKEQTVPWKERLGGGNTLDTMFSLHCVNLAQGFKAPVIEYQASHDQSDIEAVVTGYKDLMRYIGWPTGMYGGDEYLHGANPTQGTECCSVVELMFSLEKMIEITGRTDWADWLEKVAYNALPTHITDNYDGRQYYQQLNQVEVSRRARNFQTCYYGTEETFGLLTGYPCCTANLHQGWPKFVRNMWFATDDSGLAALYYGPSVVTAKVAGGTQVRLREAGGYPFTDQVQITVEQIGPKKKNKKGLAFPIHLRIPLWSDGATITVNGDKLDVPTPAGSIAVISREWKNGDVLVLSIPAKIKVGRWYEKSAAVERGPLVYALRMEEQWEKKSLEAGSKYGEWYWEVHSSTPWNWCLLTRDIEKGDPDQAYSLVRRDVSGYPWNVENAPLEIHARARQIHSWQMYNGSAGPMPFSNQYQAKLGPEEEIILIPYGCTTLRITEFPVTRQNP